MTSQGIKLYREKPAYWYYVLLFIAATKKPISSADNWIGLAKSMDVTMK